MLTPDIESIAQRLLSRLETPAQRWLIALAGVPGSGKSTLAAELRDYIGRRTQPGTIVALSIDGFHLSRAALSRMPDPTAAFARRGAPWTFDTRGMYERLLRLRAAAGYADVWWPEFEHGVGDPVENACAVPAETRLVLVEGLYLLHHADGWERISRLFDERWYLDTPLELALERLTLRHMQAWQMTRSEAEARIATNDRLNAAIVQERAACADWRVVVEETPH